MLKKEIRDTYLLKRAELSSSDYKKACQSIHDVLFSRIMMHRFSPIHLFSALTDKHEPDTGLIISTLRADFAPDLFLATVQANALIHSLYTPQSTLNTNKWGIREPLITTESMTSKAFFEKYANEDILVFVPLLAFDKNGQRVGYGKGFYDSFLKYAHKNTTIMGLSLFDALPEPIIDVSKTDIAMHFCVTPGKVWTF